MPFFHRLKYAACHRLRSGPRKDSLPPRWLRAASHQHSRITWGQLIPSPRHLKLEAQIGQMGVIGHSVLFRIRHLPLPG